jgi:hypothetical protein
MAGMLDFTLDGVPDIAVGAQGAASVLVYPNIKAPPNKPLQPTSGGQVGVK